MPVNLRIMQIRETHPLLSFLTRHDISIDTLLGMLQEQEAPALARAPNDIGYIVNYRHHPLTESIFPQYLCADTVPVTGDVAFFSIDITTLNRVLRTNEALVDAANYLVFPSQGALELCSAETFLDTRHPTLTRAAHVKFRFVHSWSSLPTNTARFGPHSASFPIYTTPDLAASYRDYSITVTPDMLQLPSIVIDSILTYISADSSEPTIKDPFDDLEWMSERLKTLNRISKKHESELSTATSDQTAHIKDKLETDVRNEFSLLSDKNVDYFVNLLLPETVRDSKIKTPTFDLNEERLSEPRQPSTLLQFTNWYAYTSYKSWQQTRDPSAIQYTAIVLTLRGSPAADPKGYGASARTAQAMAYLLQR